MGLNINIQRKIEGENLKEVTCFKYLVSYMSASCTLDDEITYRIGQAK